MQQSDYKIEATYQVVHDKDTMNINFIDTTQNSTRALFIMVISQDSSTLYISPYSPPIFSSDVGKYKQFKYPNMKIIPGTLTVTKLRTFNASKWDGKEIDY